jgi:hypothetical protein
MVINQDFKEFIQLLNENSVHYLIVGGYAVAFHGNPRYTKNLDVWIWPYKVNLENLILALKKFGFESVGLKVEDFQNSEEVVQLGYPPNRIDILTSLPGVDFKNCYGTKVATEIDNIIINFIDLENLKVNKKATGRHQDLADLEHLD